MFYKCLSFLIQVMPLFPKWLSYSFFSLFSARSINFRLEACGLNGSGTENMLKVVRQEWNGKSLFLNQHCFGSFRSMTNPLKF
jgi:hypothetical protein